MLYASTATLIWRGLAASFLGRVTLSTPLRYVAAIFSVSNIFGMAKLREKFKDDRERLNKELAKLTQELARFEQPPKNPYMFDKPIHYYWTYFVTPAVMSGDLAQGDLRADAGSGRAA